MQYTLTPHHMQFKVPAGTSRGVLTSKPGWLIQIQHAGKIGTGEISVIPGLSPEYQDDSAFLSCIETTCQEITLDELPEDLDSIAQVIPSGTPASIRFGIESALLELVSGKEHVYFQNSFTSGERQLPINGLIWMGDAEHMQRQAEEKLAQGFTTIKLKIGAIDWASERAILKQLRSRYTADELTLRVDANGAFSPEQAKTILHELAALEVHSIEQPIKAGSPTVMAALCESSPTPIALDEELIGIESRADQIALLDTIRPQYIILKPSLHGGLSGSAAWISLAEERNIAWWITSALESNVGLQTICQFTGNYANKLPQGLGTGSLYVTNSPTDLTVSSGYIFKRHNPLI